MFLPRMVLASMLIAGCSTAPHTTRQYFAATYEAISGAATSIAALAEAHKIPPDMADGYLTKLDSAKRLTDSGKAIVQCRDAAASPAEKDVCGNADAATGKIKQAESLIAEVKAVIATVAK